jgi:hypothetical protein
VRRTQETSRDVQARETEQKMTEDERFSMIISLICATVFPESIVVGSTPQE